MPEMHPGSVRAELTELTLSVESTMRFILIMIGLVASIFGAYIFLDASVERSDSPVVAWYEHLDKHEQEIPPAILQDLKAAVDQIHGEEWSQYRALKRKQMTAGYLFFIIALLAIVPALAWPRRRQANPSQ